MKKKQIRRGAWLLVSGGTAALAGAIMNRGVEAGWRAYAKDDPPAKPWRGAKWGKAVLWTAASAAIASVGELAAKDLAAAGWKHATKRLPPKR